jgi:hypothetical protein
MNSNSGCPTAYATGIHEDFVKDTSRGDPLHALLYLTVQAGVILSMLYCILQFKPGWSSPCSTVSYSSCRGDPLHALLYLTVHAGVILSMLYCILQFMPGWSYPCSTVSYSFTIPSLSGKNSSRILGVKKHRNPGSVTLISCCYHDMTVSWYYDNVMVTL